MNIPPLILYIDRFHLDDPLFVDGLGRHIASLGLEHPPLIMVHGGGSSVEASFERAGVAPVMRDGIVRPESALEIALAERAVRHQNQRLAAAMTNAVVSTLPVQGADKGFAAVGPDGRLVLGSTTWLEPIIRSGVAAIVSCLARNAAGNVLEVPPAEMVGSLAGRFGAAAVLLFTQNNRPGLFEMEEPLPEVAAEQVPADVFSEEAMLLLSQEMPAFVYLTNVRGLERGGTVRGTRVL